MGETKLHKFKIVDFLIHGSTVDKFCRYCFMDINVDNHFSIQDEVSINSEYYTGTISVANLMEFILRYEIDVDISTLIFCGKCIDEIIKNFLFRKKCHKLEDMWRDCFKLLQTNIKEIKNKSHRSQSKIYVRLKKSKVSKLKEVDSFDNDLDDCVEISPNELPIKKKNKKSQCEKCQKFFQYKCSYIRHKKYYCDVKKNDFRNCNRYLKCYVCNGLYKHRDSLLKHLKRKCLKDDPEGLSNYLKRQTYSDMPSYMCEYCGKKLRTRKGYCEHTAACSVKTANVDSKEKFVCDLCNATFYVKRSLVNHWQNKHAERSIPCHVCGKLFKTKNKILAHMIVHTRERNYKCDTCGKFFVTKHALIYHGRLHTGERPYPCTMCEERFLSASRRMAHMRKKHWEPTFKCKVCHRFCTTKSSLKAHEMRHYKCNITLTKSCV